MRIGIDTLALQSPGSRGRGVGRLGRGLVEALLRRGPGHRYILFAHDGFPIDQIPSAPQAELALLRPDPTRRETRIGEALDQLVRDNAHELDVLLSLNPFELVPGYDPPNRPLAGLPQVAFVHDLIPFLFPEQYLAPPEHAAVMYRRLRIVRRYDRLLTNSDSTRRDCLNVLDLPERRVVTVGGAVNVNAFPPASTPQATAEERALLQRAGIDRPFVLCVTGMDDRKNWRGLLQAFSLLPPCLNRHHRLVLTCWMSPESAEAVRGIAAGLGIGEQLVLTNEVSDRFLRVLYQRCAAFVFPSHYEGLGLPILEAMSCGAAVVVGNNSSQAEVVGGAGRLANSHDSAEIAAQIAALLTHPDLAVELGRRAIRRAAEFTWDGAGDRALAAIEATVESRPRGRAARPRLAIVSPWPPKRSGIADHAAKLAEALRARYSLDLVHEPGYVPQPALKPDGYVSYDFRLLHRHHRAKGYHGVLYQMGNSFYHDHVYRAFLEHGGIVTLHDFNLAGFHHWRSHAWGNGMTAFRQEVAYCYPRESETLLPILELMAREPGGMQEAFTRRSLYLNRRLLDRAEALIVHSPWCRDEVVRMDPQLAERTFVVPLGATVRPVPEGHRERVRERFGLPREARIVGGFGILSQAKLNVEAIDAFAAVAGAVPDSVLAFVGQDWERGEAFRAAAAHDLGDRVRFLGRVNDDDFADLISAVDVGLCLRRPPTYGETSAALLDLLRHGIATIVTDVATFSAYPDTIVHKVRWDADGPARLATALSELLGDAPRRRALGEAARTHIAEHHDWSRVAEGYAEVIERAAAARRGRRRRATA